MQKIKVLLPAYNEELALPLLLKSIENTKKQFQLNLEILVVNDGSDDNTPIIAQNYKGDITINCLDLKPNRGLAGAMRAGLAEAMKDLNDDDILITLDADYSHNPGLIFRMTTQIREGSDIVIASRYRHGSEIRGLSSYRKFLSWGAGLLFRIFAPMKNVRDYTCGYRAYRAAFINKALIYYGDKFIEQKGFGCMAEILLKMRKFNPIIHELPLILRYDFKPSESKMKIGKTIRQTFKLLFSKH